MKITYSLPLLLLTACTLGPDYATPENPHPPEWVSQTTEVTLDTSHSPADWWTTFQDPLLNALVADVVANNKDVAIAAANIERAKALRRISTAAFFPTANITANGRKEGLSQRNNRNNFTGEQERDTFDADLDASWELDLFGRLRREREAAGAEVHAAIEEKRGVMLSAIAELASNYFQVRGLQKRIDMTERNIALLKEIEHVAQTRFTTGSSSELDLTRARGEREAIQATLPNLKAEMMAGIYRISVLTGKAPETYSAMLEVSAPLPMPYDRIPVGVRSDLLKRRPDIRQAERTLEAATARIGAAKAQLFPSISLTGAMGSSARHFNDLFTTPGLTYSMGAGLNWSILQAAAIQADIARAEAETRAQLLAYERVVLVALEETENALMRYGKEWQTLASLLASYETRQQSFKIARLRYEAGEEDFLTILDAERTLIDARSAVIESETRILTNLTQVYKALGGGWDVIEADGTPSTRAD